MRFHGFDSVEHFLEAFRKDKHPWVVSVKSYKRIKESDWTFRDERIRVKTIPYGDPMSDIRDDKPECVKLVLVEMDIPADVPGWYLFNEDFSAYYATGTKDCYVHALAAWGYVWTGEQEDICTG